MKKIKHGESGSASGPKKKDYFRQLIGMLALSPGGQKGVEKLTLTELLRSL